MVTTSVPRARRAPSASVGDGDAPLPDGCAQAPAATSAMASRAAFPRAWSLRDASWQHRGYVKRHESNWLDFAGALTPSPASGGLAPGWVRHPPWLPG